MPLNFPPSQFVAHCGTERERRASPTSQAAASRRKAVGHGMLNQHAAQKKPWALTRGFWQASEVVLLPYSAMKSRWIEESTFTPGPMVELSVMDLM